MADNAVARFEAGLERVALSEQQKIEVRASSDTLCAELWVHFCDHQLKHLDALALRSPLDAEVQARVAALKEVVEQMKLTGMPEVRLLDPNETLER